MDFEAYVSERRRALYRFAVVLTGDPVLADDVLADTLTNAYERWTQVSSAGNVHAYVRRMLVNEYLGWRRRSARISLRDDVGDLGSPTPDHADGHAVAADLVAELRRLPPKQRAAIVLRYYEGLSFAEIAGLLGGGENAVRSNISRGLQRLRVQLVDPDLSPTEAPS
ncbi:MAG: SigE family RNA polymerase sigma factor [Jatrophihabitans sp.]|uniref:SigE family RNA polymerase sigma factor n=1 Tax=Jatrophihabitans sp. TaxID=1932789 RepID=UPI003F7D6033